MEGNESNTLDFDKTDLFLVTTHEIKRFYELTFLFGSAPDGAKLHSLPPPPTAPCHHDQWR
jgi:hypothetical protein